MYNQSGGPDLMIGESAGFCLESQVAKVHKSVGFGVASAKTCLSSVPSVDNK